MYKWRLETIVFLTGFSLMALEVTASRVMAPYFGTSIIVWTSLIGVILGSLSLGYYVGGKLSEHKPSYQTLANIIGLAALFVTASAIAKEPLLLSVQNTISDLRLSSTIAAILLFFVPSVLVGIVSPYAIRLKTKEVQTSGKTAGNLYAISTIGSIMGTFLVGFYLLQFLGNTKLLILCGLLLMLAAWICWGKIKSRFIILIAFIIALIPTTKNSAWPGLIDIDTRYNRIWVYDKYYGKEQVATRVMVFDPKFQQSAVYPNSDELVFMYGKFFRLAEYFKTNINNALMIGGAAYSCPRDFIRRNTTAKIDVVEIDPGITYLAKKYFGLKDDSRLSIFHEDARIFLNHSATSSYDIIFGDAFASSNSIPYQLTTKEAISKMYSMLRSDGVVLVNIISSMAGPKGKFLRAEYKTYQEIFPQVYLFTVEDSSPNKVQNIILVALKSTIKPDWQSQNPEISDYLKHLYTGKIDNDAKSLTDDFAPVDNYLIKLFEN
jgi:spermidine synthase